MEKGVEDCLLVNDQRSVVNGGSAVTVEDVLEASRFVFTLIVMVDTRQPSTGSVSPNEP